MINSRKDLENYIRADRQRNIGSIGFLKYRLGLFMKSESCIAFHYLTALRHCEYYHNTRANLWHRLLACYWKIRLSRRGGKYQIAIGLNMVGPGLRIPHSRGGGVIVNCLSMGCNCQINSSVVIGLNKTPDNRPIIGNNVLLSPGVKITGKCKIGDNVAIQPNSVVFRDIPDNCICSGIPAQIIKRRSDSSQSVP